MTGFLAVRVVALLAGFAVSGCAISGSSGDAATAVPTSTETQRALPLGKDDLPLAPGSYRSPEGFEPGLVVTVPDGQDGWTSVHRGADGFDVGLTGDDGDLMVAVAFLVPNQPTAEAAAGAVLRPATGAGSAVRPAAAQVGPITANGWDVLGGAGPVTSSAAGGIELDATPDGRLRVVAADVDGRPLVVAVLVPDQADWNEAWAAVEPLIAGARIE